MIKSVQITNHLGESVKIKLKEDEPSHGFLIKNIEGLGPPKAIISKSSLANVDGSVVNQTRIDSRNIIMTLLFTNAPTIEDTRQRTYKYFPIKKPVEFLIETDNKILKTTGYIESNTPTIFSKSEGNSISLVCDDPYFYSKETQATVFFGIQPLFEFPFSNDSSNDYNLMFGAVEKEYEKVVYYNGDSETGVTIRIHAIGFAPGTLTIYNTGTREKMILYLHMLQYAVGSMVYRGLVAGDDLIISSHRGNKKVEFVREGLTINAMFCMDRTSNWFSLTKGDNIFAYTVSDGSENLQFKLENKVLYEGV